MTLAFTKMHGIGNDFAVIDARHTPFSVDPALIAAMADRHTGIGFDQLLTLQASSQPDCAFGYGIWNADGSPSGQCGNGARCVAAWLYRDGAIGLDDEVRLQSPSGAVGIRIRDPGMVSVDMGEPDFRPVQIPFEAARAEPDYTLDLDGRPLQIGAVSMGNPHAVVEVDDLTAPALDALGPQLTAHKRFAQQCNAGFAQVIDTGHIRLRVHERGSGWTRACGTGACAAMAVMRLRGRVEADVHVELPGGSLLIHWPGPGHPLWMTGPATFVYEGRWLRD